MKKIFVIAFGLFFIGLLATQTVKAQENKKARKMVVGEWKLENLQSPEMDLSKMAEIEKGLMAEKLKEMKEKSLFNFMQDGKYEFKMVFMGDEKTSLGVWKVDKEGKMLITTDAEGFEEKLIIEQIKVNKMILKSGNTTTMTLVK